MSFLERKAGEIDTPLGGIGDIPASFVLIIWEWDLLFRLQWSRLLRQRFLPFQILGLRQIFSGKIVQHFACALVRRLSRHPTEAASTISEFVRLVRRHLYKLEPNCLKSI